jgi:hypothetical protein
LGLAACQSDDYFLKGPALFEQIKKTTFDGASGLVVFDPITCTRKFETLEYAFSNVFADDAMSDNQTVVFKSRVSSIIDFNAKDVVKEVHESIFSDGTTNRPPPLPAMTENMSLVPVAAIAVGWCLAGILIMCCAALAWWLYKYRNKHVVRTAQPLFLAMLLIGTLSYGEFHNPDDFSGAHVATRSRYCVYGNPVAFCAWILNIIFGDFCQSLENFHCRPKSRQHEPCDNTCKGCPCAFCCSHDYQHHTFDPVDISRPFGVDPQCRKLHGHLRAFNRELWNLQGQV